MPLHGSEYILGSGQPGDTHDTLIVAPSGCGKTELIKRALLKFWNSFNNIPIISPSLDPSLDIAPEDDDWLLFKRIARDKKIIPYYQLDVPTLEGILKQRTSEEGTSDVLVVDDCNLRGKKGRIVCDFLCDNLDNMRKRHLILLYVAFDYNQEAGVTVTFREKFDHVFWFCHPKLTTSNALERASVLNVIDPVYGQLSFAKCVTLVSTTGYGNNYGLAQLNNLTYPPNKKQRVVYVNVASQTIWDVTTTETRRLRPTSTGGVEHCNVTVQSEVVHTLPFCTGSRENLFQVYSQDLLSPNDPRRALILANEQGQQQALTETDVSFGSNLSDDGRGGSGGGSGAGNVCAPYSLLQAFADTPCSPFQLCR
jgi:hypothetical protein